MRMPVLTAAVTAALAGGLAAAPASAIEAKISGHVARALMFVDDGDRSDSFFVDPETSNTRFRFVGAGDIGGGMKAGINWEVEMVSNNSSKVSFAERNTGGLDLNERHLDVFLQGAFGKVSLGQGDGAANGGVEVDLSGTSIVNYAGVTDIGASIRFQDGGTAGPKIGEVIDQFDFESRYDRVRYDTPPLGPFGLAVSFGSKGGDGDDVIEVAGRYAGELGGGGRLAAAVGFSTRDTKDKGDVETSGGSISWLHPSGFNVTAALSHREDDDMLDADYWYLKLGYRQGRHAVSVDFASAEDEAQQGDDADMVGIGYVFKPIASVELFAGVKVHSLDRSGANFDDITIATLGSRVKF
ncbi:porin-like protein [Inmirania thermothiophila]|uniref:Porin-like protein n=2 Tax=Inmirania thermothiophila TaxID=1750597 RepID=A0A3N1Y224_9GAMM|nr:porin-like protein [Inmirania thermothiophila]